MENNPKVSYLVARDGSLYLRRNLPKQHQFNLRSAEFSTIEEDELQQSLPKQEPQSPQNIEIFLRIKKVDSLGDFYELDDNKLHCIIPENSHSNRSVPNGHCQKKIFTFSHIFGPNVPQEEVFNHIVKPKLVDFINGRNSTLMTYGASGAGKTFTIVGSGEDPGVIPRALEYLFGSLPQLSDCPKVKPTVTGAVTSLSSSLCDLERTTRNSLLTALNSIEDKQHIHTYQQMQDRLSTVPVAEIEQYKDVSIAVWISFAEIYNEQVFDLLTPQSNMTAKRTKLQLGKTEEITYIKNLSSVSVTNGLEAYKILRYGLQNLNYASTAINSHSSRSHCIFTIKLVQALDGFDESSSSNDYCVSYFNFCDLAGSERSKKTLNAGDRLKESNNINTSLMILGRCIRMVRDAQARNDNNKLIPYRESKLTMLFQRALSGKEDIAMIVNINPCLQMFDETLHALNFSAIAQKITMCTKKEQTLPAREGSNDRLERLEEENERCKSLLIKLYNEIEDEKQLQQETIEKQILGYRTIINQIEESCESRIARMEERWKNKIKRVEENLQEEHQIALENLREEYEREGGRIKRFKSSSSVINLDSDSENEDDEEKCDKDETLKARLNELNNKVNELQAELTKTKFEKSVMEQELREKNEELQEQVQQLTMQMLPLNDANMSFFN
ncbi:kinesin-like protein subito [Onthophagus taurus]|uniref:kinesin-like protein subito n=1 Tax=Onthophagus taurus TaxID=166361 RepID=UPI000C20095A|nr:kinesin-like protein subito [Onthophagus taurus]